MFGTSLHHLTKITKNSSKINSTCYYPNIKTRYLDNPGRRVIWSLPQWKVRLCAEVQRKAWQWTIFQRNPGLIFITHFSEKATCFIFSENIILHKTIRAFSPWASHRVCWQVYWPVNFCIIGLSPRMSDTLLFSVHADWSAL